MRTALFAAIAVAVLACNGDNGPSGPPSVTLGTGDTAFESLTAGQDIFVIQGPQGGHHFLGSVRARNIEPGDPEDLQDPSNPTVLFSAFQGGQRIDALASRYVQGLDPVSGSDDYEMIGRLVVLNIADDEVLNNATVRLDVEITDANGVVVSDSRELVAIPHPANQ